VRTHYSADYIRSLMPKLVDRTAEVAALRSLAKRNAPALALLYGRRRVGKTFLLDHAWPKSQRVFYFLAADTTSDQNRVELIHELARWSRTQIDPDNYRSWRNVFRLFVDMADQHSLVVVLDEFQYLMGTGDDVVSHLVAVWDRELKDKPLTLVLSGSQVGMMERLERGNGPLYGRPNWVARLHPFDYRDAARTMPKRSHRDAAVLYGVFGGTPRYLATIHPADTIAARVMESMLSPHGDVHTQLANLIEQEKGIRDPAEYRAVLAAVAAGRTLTDEIAHAAGLGDRPHVVQRALHVLEGLELVERERNFGAAERTPWRTKIADNAVRFWYRFVSANRSRLERGKVIEVWNAVVAPSLDTYMGKVFERMARDAYTRFHDVWKLPADSVWARWEGQDRNRRNIELDVVASLDDGRMLLGEVKWSSRPFGPELHSKIMRDVEDLAHSGQKWAHDSLRADAAVYIYFSAGGFTKAFSDLAKHDSRIRLVSLREMYRG
jgi:AAA+ ATPase superfamily predicted ATPase